MPRFRNNFNTLSDRKQGGGGRQMGLHGTGMADRTNKENHAPVSNKLGNHLASTKNYQTVTHENLKDCGNDKANLNGSDLRKKVKGASNQTKVKEKKPLQSVQSEPVFETKAQQTTLKNFIAKKPIYEPEEPVENMHLDDINDQINRLILENMSDYLFGKKRQKKLKDSQVRFVIDWSFRDSVRDVLKNKLNMKNTSTYIWPSLMQRGFCFSQDPSYNADTWSALINQDIRQIRGKIKLQAQISLEELFHKLVDPVDTSKQQVEEKQHSQKDEMRNLVAMSEKDLGNLIYKFTTWILRYFEISKKKEKSSNQENANDQHNSKKVLQTFQFLPQKNLSIRNQKLLNINNNANPKKIQNIENESTNQAHDTTATTAQSYEETGISPNATVIEKMIHDLTKDANQREFSFLDFEQLKLVFFVLLTCTLAQGDFHRQVKDSVEKQFDKNTALYQQVHESIRMKLRKVIDLRKFGKNSLYLVSREQLDREVQRMYSQTIDFHYQHMRNFGQIIHYKEHIYKRQNENVDLFTWVQKTNGQFLIQITHENLEHTFAISKLHRRDLTPWDIAHKSHDFDKGMFFAWHRFDVVEITVPQHAILHKQPNENAVQLMKQVPLFRRYGVPMFHSIFLTHVEFDDITYKQKALKYESEMRLKYINDRLARDEKESKQKVNPQKIAEAQEKVHTPVPNAKHTYCGICRRHYDDYFRHIYSSGHRISCDKDKNFNLIDDLIDEFDQKLHDKWERERKLLELERSTQMFDCSQSAIMSDLNLNSILITEEQNKLLTDRQKLKQEIQVLTQTTGPETILNKKEMNQNQEINPLGAANPVYLRAGLGGGKVVPAPSQRQPRNMVANYRVSKRQRNAANASQSNAQLMQDLNNLQHTKNKLNETFQFV